jgi:hypothetical protein
MHPAVVKDSFQIKTLHKPNVHAAQISMETHTGTVSNSYVFHYDLFI